MNRAIERKWSALAFNPFIYIAGGRALALGLAAMVLTALAAWAGGTHFDGIIDAHLGSTRPLLHFLAEGGIDWLCLALILAATGRLISKTSFRFIDVLGTQALARWPTFVIALLMLPPGVRRYGVNLVRQMRLDPTHLNLMSPDALYFAAAVVLSLPIIGWMLVLMYMAYSVSCNVRGAKGVLSFIAALILAELASKVAIYSLP